ncbi:unnamed protein product [Paramecium sonneborni]|uniref:Transmembrane protein n=1 Tax=Paramecium sonneborni TaxID=65129 RepID=A0A8S1PKA2_9CILI|nr:unnamed protein product [Paramecium sonneborni]
MIKLYFKYINFRIRIQIVERSGIFNYDQFQLFCIKQLVFKYILLFVIQVFQILQYINQIMHNFLFGNRLSTYSPFSPFGSSKNSKPGIITKIKNKIQDLFQPSINPSSTIQRIQCYNELNLEKELSHQFKNNLVIVDHILPNNQTSKRKSLYPFDLYLQELIQKQNQISEEPIINQAIKLKDQQPYLSQTKKQMKFKKNHAKIQKPRKMEANSSLRDLEFNKKSQDFNVELNQENSTSFQSNQSIKKIKFQENCIETASPSYNQKGQKKQQMSQINQFEIQSFANIKQNQQFSCQQLNDKKKRNSETQNRLSCKFKQFIQENQYFSSSTGTNTKGEPQEALFNMEHISFSQESDSSISEEQCQIENDSFEIKNKLFSIFHPDHEKQRFSDVQQEQEQIKYSNELKNNQNLSQNKQSIDNLEKQNKINKQRNLKLDSDIISLQISCIRQNQNESNQQFKVISEIQQEQQEFITQEKQDNKQNDDSNNNYRYDNIIISNAQQCMIENNQSIQENNDKLNQDAMVEQRNQNQLCNKQLDDKLDSSQSQNTLMSMNYESPPKVSKIIQEYDQQKDLSRKNNQLQKQNNPFLDTGSHIDSNQVSQYFLSGLLIGNSQFFQQQQQNIRNQNHTDLFKMPTNNQLFKFNVLSDIQTYQTQPQNLFNEQNIIQKNNQCLIYEQMETIDQIPLNDQFNYSQQNIYHQPISNYYQPNFEQNYQSQSDAFQQSQSSNPWNSYQAPLQQQNLFPQMHINLFQSNSSIPNSNSNCTQESRINHIYTKQDVLSLFSETNKKKDQSNLYNIPLDLFVIDSIQSSNSQSQNLNNSFNKGYRKKQRINID